MMSVRAAQRWCTRENPAYRSTRPSHPLPHLVDLGEFDITCDVELPKILRDAMILDGMAM